MIALVVGGTGGIGGGIVEQLACRDSCRKVIATYKNTCPEFDHPKVHWVKLDVTCEEDVAEMAKELDSLDLCLNTVGMLHTKSGRPEKAVKQLETEFFMDSIKINTLPTMLLAKHLAANLKASPSAVFASISARVGSIEENRLGGWYSYRSSKAALNMMLKTLAIEWRVKLPHCCVASLHPGTTDTPLSKPFQRNMPAEKLFSPSRCARQLLSVIDQLSPEQTGKFWSWDGTELPW